MLRLVWFEERVRNYWKENVLAAELNVRHRIVDLYRGDRFYMVPSFQLVLIPDLRYYRSRPHDERITSNRIVLDVINVDHGGELSQCSCTGQHVHISYYDAIIKDLKSEVDEKICDYRKEIWSGEIDESHALKIYVV
jgi:hypothetical protein